MTYRSFLVAVAAGLGLLACRGDAQRARGTDPLARVVDSMRGPVERAAGLRFKRPPRSAIRSREQVRAYLTAKLDEELPPAKQIGRAHV